MRPLTPTNESFLQVMEETGFYRNGEPTHGVISSASLTSNSANLADKQAKYKAVVDENKLGASAIYELSGSPCIYFKTLADNAPSPLQLEELHQLAWNQGLAPLMWVVTPSQIRVYNSFAKPLRKYSKSSEPLLDTFERTKEGLRQLNDFAGRVQFESGRFWQQEAAQRIDRKNRVDASLLRDLELAEKTLIEIKVDAVPEVKNSVAHSLLGRSIFAAYLQDRKIISPTFMAENFGADKIADILQDKKAAYQLFAWIRRTFNGDLFRLTHQSFNGVLFDEEQIVSSEHLQVIHNLLENTGITNKQLSFWPYKFDVIPVELISSIYEMFARSNDPVKAKKQSMHYTPFNLVDMVLSEICPSLPAKAKVADLSCGSGVFLVEALRRLVAQRAAAGEDISREIIRDTLYNQVYGVDISPEAVQIAAFSLYLTALELDRDPQPLEALKFEPLIGRNLFAADAFDEDAEFNKQEPFAGKNLDAIVGNPPWTQEAVGSSGRQYCARHKRPVAKNYLSQAFLWRSGDFAAPHTYIGLLLNASPFFSHTKEAYAAKRALLQRFKPTALVNFAELHQQSLFPNAVAPLLMYIGKSQATADKDTFALINAEWSSTFKKLGILEIGPENVKRLSVSRAAADRDLLKVACWGTARDMALIERLRDSKQFKPLGEIVKEWGWPAPAIGLEITSEGQSLHSGLPSKYLPQQQVTQYTVDATKAARNADTIKVRYQPKNANRFHGPLVLASRGITDKGFYSTIVESDIIYTREYIGLPATGVSTSMRYLLNGILNSSSASYFLFMTASVWGVERRTVEAIDLLRLPIPDPKHTDAVLIERVLDAERTIASQGVSLVLKQQLDNAVFDLYAISSSERVLVEDTLRFTIDAQLKRAASSAYARTDLAEQQAYAMQFMDVIKPYLTTLNLHRIVAEVIDVGSAPLSVVRFKIAPTADKVNDIQITSHQELQSVLESIASKLPHQLADRVYTRRNLRIYNGDDIIIVKPSQKRFWSRSSGLNDASLVLAESMGVEDVAG